MSDIVLRSTARTQIELRNLVDHMKGMVERLTDEERGQDTIEYIGVLAVVAVVIGVLLAVVPNLSTTISQGASSLINKVFNAAPQGPGK